MCKERNKARNLYVPRVYALLFTRKEREVQSKEENQQEEVCEEMQRNKSTDGTHEEVHRLIGSMRTLTMEEITLKLNRILTGYYHYYGITDNTPSIKKFRYNVLKSLFYWINRRSQKQSYNWNEFLRTIDANYQLAKGRVYVSVYE